MLNVEINHSPRIDLQPLRAEALVDRSDSPRYIEVGDQAPEIESSSLDALLRSGNLLGIYLAQCCSLPILTREEEAGLGIRIRQGSKEAVKMLFMHNTRLVVARAFALVGRGVPVLDLIQEGNIALMAAAEKFDPDRGAKFSTYATWGVNDAMYTAIREQGRSMSIPRRNFDTLIAIRGEWRRFCQENGREPSEEEIARNLGMPLAEVGKLIQCVTWGSLNTPLLDKAGEETNEEVIEEIRAPGLGTEEAVLMNIEFGDAMSGLNKRAKTVLFLRLGLEDGHPCTLQEVGDILGISYQRVWEIEDTAIERLRRGS